MHNISHINNYKRLLEKWQTTLVVDFFAHFVDK